jgi:hypothetical protein
MTTESIFFKKWTIVRPCFSPKADHVAHGFKTKKKKEYKDDFFKNIIGRLIGRFRIKEKIIDMLLR